MIKKIGHQKSQLLFGNQLNNELDTILKKDYKNSKKVIITDENVYDLWIEDLISNTEELHQAEIIQLPAGESTKTIGICYQVWETLADYKINRNDLIINFGGGVITDIGGFIASTFKRGLSFINIPTTLLAQVDASVGGKTGVDLNHHKNQIGTYALPDYVFIDEKYLTTLTNKQLKSGFAEMLKHGLIKDAKHWNNLINIQQLTAKSISPHVYDSVFIKHQIVEADPLEKGKRKSLNFGHTFGHAYESLLLKSGIKIEHGYAVALGIIFEANLSKNIGLITLKELKEIQNYITSFYEFKPLSINDIDDLIELMKHDKKNNNQEINFTLLKEIGGFEIDCIINEDLIRKNLTRIIHNYSIPKPNYLL
jgi:3-dehydroquinate synthase